MKDLIKRLEEGGFAQPVLWKSSDGRWFYDAEDSQFGLISYGPFKSERDAKKGMRRTGNSDGYARGMVGSRKPPKKAMSPKTGRMVVVESARPKKGNVSEGRLFMSPRSDNDYVELIDHILVELDEAQKAADNMLTRIAKVIPEMETLDDGLAGELGKVSGEALKDTERFYKKAYGGMSPLYNVYSEMVGLESGFKKTMKGKR